MKKKASLPNFKLVRASNAMNTTYQVFSEDLKRFGFVKKVENAKKAFQLPHRAN